MFQSDRFSYSDTEATPDEAVRRQRIAIFQCVRTSVNGVVKILVVPISRTDQCLPVVVQQQRSSGETRRAVVPAGSTIVFGDDLDVLRARHVPVRTNARGFPVDLSRVAVSEALRGRQHVPFVPETCIRLCVPREAINTATADGSRTGSASSEGPCRSGDDGSKPEAPQVVIGLDYDAGGFPGIPQHTTMTSDPNVVQDNGASSGSNMVWSSREAPLSDNAMKPPECPKMLQNNAEVSYDNVLSYDQNAESSHCENTASAYDGMVTREMNTMSNDSSTVTHYPSDIKQEGNNNVVEQSSDDTGTSIRIEHCCSLSVWDGHSDFVQHQVSEISPSTDDQFRQPTIDETDMPKIKSETPSHVTDETDVGHLNLPDHNVSASGLEGHQYTDAKLEWADQEIESNWQVGKRQRDTVNFAYENNVMLTCQSTTGTEQCQMLDGTNGSETSHYEANRCHKNPPELLPKRFKRESFDFDYASTLSAHNITECSVRLEPLSYTYTQQHSVNVTKPREAVYSCRQLGPTTIKLVRKNNVAAQASDVPGAILDTGKEQNRRTNKVRWVTGSGSNTLHNTRCRSAAKVARHSNRHMVYIDSPLTGDTLDTPGDQSPSASDDVHRTQSLQDDNQTPTAQHEVSGGNCMLIFKSSSASLVPLQAAPKSSAAMSRDGNQLAASRTELSRTLQRVSPSRVPVVDPSTAYLRLHGRYTRGQDTFNGLSDSDYSSSRRLAVGRAQCTKHLERLLRYHERVVLEVRALLRKNGKVDGTNFPTSTGGTS